MKNRNTLRFVVYMADNVQLLLMGLRMSTTTNNRLVMVEKSKCNFFYSTASSKHNGAGAENTTFRATVCPPRELGKHTPTGSIIHPLLHHNRYGNKTYITMTVSIEHLYVYEVQLCDVHCTAGSTFYRCMYMCFLY